MYKTAWCHVWADIEGRTEGENDESGIEATIEQQRAGIAVARAGARSPS